MIQVTDVLEPKLAIAKGDMVDVGVHLNDGVVALFQSHLHVEVYTPYTLYHIMQPLFLVLAVIAFLYWKRVEIVRENPLIEAERRRLDWD